MALDAYKMRIVAQALRVLRQKIVALRLVNQDFSMEARAKNEVISIPDSVAQAVQDVTPAATPPALAQVDPDERLLRLDQWKETYFDAVDKDEVEANVGWFMRQTEQAAKALANNIDATSISCLRATCPLAGAWLAPHRSTTRWTSFLRRTKR